MVLLNTESTAKCENLWHFRETSNSTTWQDCPSVIPRLVVESVCVCLQYREVWLQEGAVQEAGSDGVAES